MAKRQKGEAREPVDGELLRPGWVREPDGREEELRVTLDWGTDEETGQQWLRVTDNGVGMTEQVIKNYFTADRQEFLSKPGVQPGTSRLTSDSGNNAIVSTQLASYD